MTKTCGRQSRTQRVPCPSIFIEYRRRGDGKIRGEERADAHTQGREGGRPFDHGDPDAPRQPTVC